MRADPAPGSARPNFEHHLRRDELAGLCAALGIIVKYIEPNNEGKIFSFWPRKVLKGA
jgi:hypothetical protein